MIASPILSALKEATQYIGKKIDNAVEKVMSRKDDSLSVAVGDQTRILSNAVLRIEKAIDKIKDPKFEGEVTVDTSSLEEELSGIARDIKNIKAPNLSAIEKSLKGIYECIEDQKQITIESFTEVVAALKGISLDIPGTFKLDEMQMRALSNTGRGMSLGGQAVQPARNITMTNLALTATDTQYSYTFPANTVRWQIKLRDQGTLAYYTYTTGTLPTVGGGGDGSKYVTIPQNFLQSEDGIDWTGKVIYLGAESASQVAEIIVYTL